MKITLPAVTLLVASTLLVVGCKSESKNSALPNTDSPRVSQPCIKADAKARDEILTRLFEAQAGDVVELCAGKFDMPTGLLINSKPGITLKGAGMNKTILNFKDSDSAEGINASHSDGLILEGFSVEDTPGNGIRIYRSESIIVRHVLVRWHDLAGRNEKDPGYTPRSDVGAYALYPVETRNVLMEDCEAHGASDAGIYVGQSNDVLVRRCLATYNVAGYEFENTYRAVFEDNIATKNTGGFLIFDLPDLRQYGARNIVRRNKAFDNNTANFAPAGNIVGLVPRGTGMLILAADEVEIYDNEIYDNDSLGIAMVNYGLVDSKNADLKYDFYPEGIMIRDNKFWGNGTNPQLPDINRGVASALPAILRLKALGRGADIVWDGGEDTLDESCAFPVDRDGKPLNQANPNETDRYEARVDARGRPNFDRPDPEPSCRYNAWKFDENKRLKKPENGLCIQNNTHESSPTSTPFLNAKFARSEVGPTLIQDLLTPASTDMSPHNCSLSYTESIRPLALPYKIRQEERPPTDAEVARLCRAVKPGEVNWSALAKVNCPELSQFGLFSDPANPLSAGNGQGVMPYELNTALFSDYSSKDRVIFLPPQGGGGILPARYLDSQGSVNKAMDTLEFPVGTVIAKTFSFRKEASNGELQSEHIVETRLLIKRQQGSNVNWVGLPYIWEHDSSGKPQRALLKVAGGTAKVSWNYRDPNPAVQKNGARAVYQGSSDGYVIPAALNCVSCHGGDNREPGSAPIGPKARYLDRPHNKDGTGPNQLALMRSKGLLTGIATNPDKPVAIWDVPGSGPSKAPANSALDVHERVRAYLEMNCAHCHNPNGGASNSGLFLDSVRPVNRQYGICKKPVAAGRGSGNRKFDIILGDPAGSILNFRVGSAEPGIRMPPIAKAQVHGEAAALINEWVNTSLPALNAMDDDMVRDEEACSGGELPLLINELAPAELNDLLKTLQQVTGGALPISAVTDLLNTIARPLGLSSADQRRSRSQTR